jgi:hypothetical protein
MSDIFQKAGNILASAAPTVASLFGGPLAGQAVSLIESTLGIQPTGDKQAAALALLSATPDQIIALKKADDDLKQKYLDAGVSIIQASAEDRTSARSMQIQTKSLVAPALAMTIVIAWCVIQGFLLGHSIPTDMREIVARILGTLDSALMLVLSFYFGSSSSSEGKNALIDKALGSTPPT